MECVFILTGFSCSFGCFLSFVSSPFQIYFQFNSKNTSALERRLLLSLSCAKLALPLHHTRVGGRAGKCCWYSLPYLLSLVVIFPLFFPSESKSQRSERLSRAFVWTAISGHWQQSGVGPQACSIGITSASRSNALWFGPSRCHLSGISCHLRPVEFLTDPHL